jgi:hypothetical protein
MSSDTFDLIAAAKKCAHAAWPKRHVGTYGFTKAGIMLDDFVRFEDRPRTLFDAEKPTSQALMTALDEVNGRFGKRRWSWQARVSGSSSSASPAVNSRSACPLCQGSCPLLYFSSIYQVGGIGR